jgi:hypothetical protein
VICKGSHHLMALCVPCWYWMTSSILDFIIFTFLKIASPIK